MWKKSEQVFFCQFTLYLQIKALSIDIYIYFLTDDVMDQYS